MIKIENKKLGRPYSADTEKSITKRARMTEADADMLKFCSDILGKSESEIIRLSIKKLYDELKAN